MLFRPDTGEAGMGMGADFDDDDYANEYDDDEEEMALVSGLQPMTQPVLGAMLLSTMSMRP